ncbi:MAG: hypothetical protein JWL76_523 [Thermoleophilia bacterium]|nr:hypothetical protein [Thermoleophilia bacterium]
MQTADVIAFPSPTTVDLEEVHVRAATMDFLAELVEAVDTDGFVAIDAGLAEELRSLADVLLQLADAEADAGSGPDASAYATVGLRTQLARSADLIRRAAVPICHSSARRMFGGALYERVHPVVMVLGELSTLAYERSLDAHPAALIEEMPIRRFGRVAAQAYDWAQWSADAPPHLRAVLVDALEAAAARAREYRVVDGDELAPVDAAPLMDALETLLDEWLACMPGDVLAEFAAERDPDPLFGDCFDIGVACSIARRLIVATGAALPDTADIDVWLNTTSSLASGRPESLKHAPDSADRGSNVPAP